MYDIDGEQFIKTIHENPRKGHAGTPGTATIDLQIKKSLRRMSLMTTFPKKSVISSTFQDTN